VGANSAASSDDVATEVSAFFKFIPKNRNLLFISSAPAGQCAHQFLLPI
jgi:hypothetical protein